MRGRQAVRFAPVPDRATRYTVASSHIGKAQIGRGLRGLVAFHRIVSSSPLSNGTVRLNTPQCGITSLDAGIVYGVLASVTVCQQAVFFWLPRRTVQAFGVISRGIVFAIIQLQIRLICQLQCLRASNQ